MLGYLPQRIGMLHRNRTATSRSGSTNSAGTGEPQDLPSASGALRFPAWSHDTRSPVRPCNRHGAICGCRCEEDQRFPERLGRKKRQAEHGKTRTTWLDSTWRSAHSSHVRGSD